MKNKKVTYLLLPVVLLIWGIIFYKIFSAVGHKDVIPTENISVGSMLPEKSEADTFSISSGYRDPFLGKMAITPSESDKPKLAIKKIEKPPAEPLKWPTIVYRGMIKNQKTNKQLYLVSINNQDNMMMPGNVVSEVELKKVYKDSIEVVYKKEARVFRK